MQFKDLIGQQKIKNQLNDLVQNTRPSHYLLFIGRDGSGSLPLSIAFAQYILCEKVHPDKKQEKVASLFGSPAPDLVSGALDARCGICPSCIKAAQLIHPDLHFSYPALKRDSKHDRVLSTDYISEWREFVKQSPYNNVVDWINFLKENAKIENPINKQGNITAFECDDISHKLSLKPFEGAYKILIMWMPEFLGNSGNKLLKLIEEPPPDTIFIFVAEDENAILSTVLSRTQLVKIPTLTQSDIENILIKQYKVPTDKALQIAAISEGNFREALLLLQNSDEGLLMTIREWLNITVKNNVPLQVKWIDDVSKKGREKQKQLLKYFIHLIEQGIRVRYLDEKDLISIPESEKDFAIRLNKICGIEAQEAIINELDKAIYHIERNAHAKMLFHALTIRFLHIIRDNSLSLVN